MVSGSEVGESHSMEYSHTPQGGLRTKSLEFGKEVKNRQTKLEMASRQFRDENHRNFTM